MSTLISEYLGDLRIETTHGESNTKLFTDAAIDNGGKGESFSPTDLCAISLSTCAMTMLGLYAQANNMDLRGTKITTKKTMSAKPRMIASVEVTFTMPPLEFSEKDKIVLERVARTCPVHHSLGEHVEQKLIFVWP